jgi:tetratricopeptide (TPR) repeat protein
LHKPPNYGKNPDILVNIANAYFCDSKHKEAIRSLSRAVRSNPSDAALWHNCGVIQYAFAQELFDRHSRKAGVNAVNDFTSAGKYAESAKRMFSMLHSELEQHDTNPSEWGTRLKATNMDIDKMSELISYCDKAITLGMFFFCFCFL